MAFGDRTIADFGGAAKDILSGYAAADADKLKAQGLRSEAVGYGLAATYAGQNEKYTEESTGVQLAAIQRNFEKAEGTTGAAIAGAGFENSGSAADIIRSNTQQGAVAHQVASEQGLITEAGYNEQKASYLNMQSAANAAADKEDDMASSAITNGWITGGISAAAGIATLGIL